jgi:hypothetical protein
MLLWGTFGAQAMLSPPEVAHFIECLHLMLTDPVRHRAECSPSNIVADNVTPLDTSSSNTTPPAGPPMTTTVVLPPSTTTTSTVVLPPSTTTTVTVTISTVVECPASMGASVTTTVVATSCFTF